jgi:hypothetical protein
MISKQVHNLKTEVVRIAGNLCCRPDERKGLWLGMKTSKAVYPKEQQSEQEYQGILKARNEWSKEATLQPEIQETRLAADG